MHPDRCKRRRQHGCRRRVGRLARPLLRSRHRQRGQFGMSARQVEPKIAVVHPRETTALSGHREAEQALLNAYRSGRIPHAWLIGGAQGIGKATLAYRMARFVLAHRDPLAADVRHAEALQVDPSDPVARHIAAGAHGSLLTLERSLNDKGVMRTVITVDETRETISFFGSTAAVDGWRVCIVDTVDELNPNAANALLKILEEPPPRCSRRCRRSIRVNCTRSVTPWVAATALRLRPSSTASIAGSAKSCVRATPTPTFRALHGWRRYGKRSSAPRAIPKPTIWSENRWFSRYSGCSRKPRGRRSASDQS